MPLSRTSSRLLLSTKAARCRQQRNRETFLYLTVWPGHWPNHPPSEYESRNNKPLNYFFRFEKQRYSRILPPQTLCSSYIDPMVFMGFSHVVFEVAFTPWPRSGQVTILSTQGIEGIGVAIESFAAMQRPVLYFSLREATSSRDLHMAMLLGVWKLREVHRTLEDVFFLPVAYLVILKMYMICFSNKSDLRCTCNTSTAYIYIYMYTFT